MHLPRYQVLIAALALGSSTFCPGIPKAIGANLKNAISNVVGKGEPERTPIREKWALLFAVSNFNDPELGPLPNAGTSAELLAATLKNPDIGRFASDHVLKVAPAEANRGALDNALDNWLYKKALPNDLIIIYLNGRIAADPKLGEPYLLAADSLAKEPSTTGIALSELVSSVKQRTGSSNIILLLDVNPAEKYQIPEAAKAKDLKWLATKGATVLSASALYKPSYDSSQSKATKFSHYLSEGLKASGGLMPFILVAEYVYQNVKQESESVPAKSQEPFLSMPANDSPVANLALGMPVKSSTPPKSIAIGHPIDEIAMSRPDLIAPRAQAGKPNLSISSRKAAPKPAVAKAKEKVLAEVGDEEDEVDNNLDFGAYMTKMRQDIQKRWAPPKGLESRRVKTVFSIMKDGSIVNARIVEGSGNEAMDLSAMEALKVSSPIDPLPKGAPSSVDIQYVFDWKSKRAGE